MLRILNVVLLENFPLLVIQCFYLSSDSDVISEHSVSITVITIVFSALSILSGISSMMAFGCSHCVGARRRQEGDTMTLSVEFFLKENVTRTEVQCLELISISHSVLYSFFCSAMCHGMWFEGLQ